MNCKLIRLIVLSFSIGFVIPASSQNFIFGYVSDSLHRPIGNVTITYSISLASNILGFSQTQQSGYFKLLVNNKYDSILLKLDHIGFEPQIHWVKNRTDSFSFLLTSRTQLLKEVIIKNVPVFKINDTINYNVRSFTSKEDRVIADVIKKVPGIEIENGQIKYQGKPIQEFLINGLNLLDEKYQLANNNIPVDAVQNVQIIENHQPVKILDSLIFSDRASLNLQLKKITTTGIGKIFVGYRPLLWDVDLTPMIFTKNFQTLNSYQANNSGSDVASELFASTTVPNNLFNLPPDLSLRRMDFLTVQNPQNPPFEKERWFNNHTNLFSSNIINRLGNGAEIKVNISFYNDHSLESGKNIIKLFIPGSTVFVSEQIDNSVNTNDLRASFSLTKNVRKIYLKNEFKFGTVLKTENGFILRDSTAQIVQNKDFNGLNASNNFSSITFLGKQLLNINSQINYFKNPQQLIVVPGSFDSLLNNGNPYTKVLQLISFENFDMNNSISMVKGIKKISFAPKAGFKYGNQNLQSNLHTFINGNEKKLNGEFGNNINYRTTSIYFELLTQYKNRRIRAELTLPIQIQEFNIRNQITFNQTTFDPKGFLKVNLSPFWNFSIFSKYSNNFGGINQLYGGYILNTYNNIQRYGRDIPLSKVWESYLSFDYSNASKALFANIVINNSKEFNNYIFSDIVDSNGMKTINFSNQKNQQFSTSFSGDIGKYMAYIETSIKLKALTVLSGFEQIVNNKLIQISQQQYTMGLSISNTTVSFLNINYNGILRFINTQTENKDIDNIITQIHSLNVGLVPIKNHSLSCKIDYYINDLKAQPHQTFADLTYRIYILKPKVNLELRCTNILNSKLYTGRYISTYSIIESSFQLRPRQFIIGTWFKI